MKKRNATESRHGLKTVVSLLLICVLLASIFVSGTLSHTVYAADTTISVAPGNGVTLQNLKASTGNGPYHIEDEYGTVWTNGTEVEIFRSSYENGEHEITVAGKDGSKVIAPGTENIYTFAIHNNYADSVDYKVTVEAFFTGLDGTDKVIPMQVRLQGKQSWLVGSEEEWAPVLQLNGAEESAFLSRSQHALYTLQWRWPFEQDLNGDGNIDDGDALDTWLATQEQDISLTIRIIVQASEHYAQNEPSNIAVPNLLNGTQHFAYLYGYPDGTVRPNNNITRAETAAILYRLIKDSIRDQYETANHPYSDIPADAWYQKEVATLTAMDLFKGYPDGTFRPDQPITRAEVAALLARISEREISSEGKTEFTDIKDHWAEAKIMTIEDLNWIYGYPDGTFLPDQPITRAETVAMFNRVLHRNPQKLSDLLPDMKTWPDNADPEAWYYLDIQEASNGHTYQRLLGIREKWIALTDLENE